MDMKFRILMMAAVAAMAATGCNSEKAAPDVTGEWYVTAYNPAHWSSYTLADTDTEYKFVFDADSSFYCATDCNSLGGQYTVNADSMRFDNMLSTEMACESELFEMSMKQLLPGVRTFEMSADSVLSLKGDGGHTLLKLTKKH